MIPLPLLLQALVGLVAGAALGLIHFELLRQNAGHIVAGRLGAGLFTRALRFAVLIAGLVGLAWVGSAALLSAGVGILVGRAAVLRRSGA